VGDALEVTPNQEITNDNLQITNKDSIDKLTNRKQQFGGQVEYSLAVWITCAAQD
jgi:hypothetical protein